MKRKVRLLFALVLVVTMMLGMSVSVLAEPLIDEIDITVTPLTRDKLGGVLPTTSVSLSSVSFGEDHGYSLFDINKELLFAYTEDMYFDLSTGNPTSNPDCSNVMYVTEWFGTASASLDVDNLVVKCNGVSMAEQEHVYTNECVNAFAKNGDEKIIVSVIVFEGTKTNPKKVDKTNSTKSIKSTNSKKETPAKEIPAKEIPAKEIIDRDTFKSEADSKTVIVADSIGADSFFDLKVHKADAKSTANQEFLAKSLVGPNVQILLTQNIYPRRDLSIAENGSLQTLTWNNLPKNQPGPVYAVVYNQIDGAYEINGVLDTNGTAVFNGFKLRSASTITICK